jgi:YbbR domain-containing protein
MEKYIEYFKKFDFKDFGKRFISNLPFKLVATLIAFVLWFVVLNVTNPIVLHTALLDLHLINANEFPADRFLINASALSNEQIAVQLRGTQREIDELTDRLVAYIDLSADYIYNHTRNAMHFSVTVNVRPTDGDWGNVVWQNTRNSVLLAVEEVITREIEIEFESLGEPEHGFIALWDRAVINPLLISVSGPHSEVVRIDRIMAVADVSELDYHLHSTAAELLAYDLADGEVSLNNMRFANVEIFVPVYRLGHVRVLTPEFEGVPAVGYGAVDVSIAPVSFAVAGPLEIIESLGDLRLGAVSVEGANSRVTEYYDVRDYLPEEVLLVHPAQFQIRADVVIESVVVREFILFAENIAGVGSLYDYQILTREVTVNISAMESILRTVGTLSGWINLNNLEEGQHQVNVIINNLPAGAQVVGGAPSVSVMIGDGTHGGSEGPYDPGNPGSGLGSGLGSGSGLGDDGDDDGDDPDGTGGD